MACMLEVILANTQQTTTLPESASPGHAAARVSPARPSRSHPFNTPWCAHSLTQSPTHSARASALKAPVSSSYVIMRHWPLCGMHCTGDALHLLGPSGGPDTSALDHSSQVWATPGSTAGNGLLPAGLGARGSKCTPLPFQDPTTTKRRHGIPPQHFSCRLVAHQ